MLEATHQSSHSLFFTANYTWAHNLSDAQGDAPNGFQGETRYGLADLNRFGISDNRFGNVAQNAWPTSGNFCYLGAMICHSRPRSQVVKIRRATLTMSSAVGLAPNTITLLETGPYLTPTISCSFDQTNTAPFLEGSVCRPDMIGDPTSGNQPGKQFNRERHLHLHLPVRRAWEMQASAFWRGPGPSRQTRGCRRL